MPLSYSSFVNANESITYYLPNCPHFSVTVRFYKHVRKIVEIDSEQTKLLQRKPCAFFSPPCTVLAMYVYTVNTTSSLQQLQKSWRYYMV